MISAYSPAESLSSQRKRREKWSVDKSKLRAEWRVGLEEKDKEEVGEW